MADTKISALPSGAPAQAGDEYVIARSGANYKLTGTNLLGLVTSTANTFSADQTFGVANATTLDATNVEVTNLKAKDGTAAATIANSTGVIAVSTKVEYADGTAAAPTVTNTGDTDTGVYFPAANEVAVSAGGTVAAAFNSNGLFFRNRIINGDMRIDQRNAGAAVTINSTANTYTVDRWFASGQSADGVFTVQQDTVVPAGFINSSKVTVTTADASLGATQSYIFRQAIEGTNVADLGWGAAGALTVTLSFWIRSSVTGTFGGVLQNAANDRNYPFTYVINAANTWEYKTVTVAGDTTGTWGTGTGRGITVTFSLGSGASASATAGAWTGTSGIYGATGATNLMATLSATWYVTGVQLETGSVATPFERRPFGTELMLCQRYCQKLAGDTAYTVVTDGWQSATTSGTFTYSFGNPMRASPTLTTGTVGDFYARNGSISSALSTLALDGGLNSTKETVSFSATWAGAGGAAGYGAQLVSGANAPRVILSAEL
jgi:hypothetical protein